MEYSLKQPETAREQLIKELAQYLYQIIIKKSVQSAYQIIEHSRIEDQCEVVARLREIFGNPEGRLSIHDHHLTHKVYKYFSDNNLHKKPQTVLVIIGELEKVVEYSLSLEDS